MRKFIKACLTIISTLVSAAFMFIPEALFEKYIIFSKWSIEINIIINRILFSLFLTIIVAVIYVIYICNRKKITITGKDYIIEVKYGDIKEEKNCKKVINFDECYTTEVGELPHQIKPTSICGQYLLQNPNLNINKLIKKNKINKSESNSLFENKIRYDSGTIVPNGDDLLMAFAKLDEKGSGKFFSNQEYLDSLSNLWKEIDMYYGQKDVCIPILGSGLTRINDSSLSQQELLEKIILSYKLSPHKIKKPYKLRIICKENDGFSLNKIGEDL
jgi:hypothetical protein